MNSAQKYEQNDIFTRIQVLNTRILNTDLDEMEDEKIYWYSTGTSAYELYLEQESCFRKQPVSRLSFLMKN